MSIERCDNYDIAKNMHCMANVSMSVMMRCHRLIRFAMHMKNKSSKYFLASTRS